MPEADDGSQGTAHECMFIQISREAMLLLINNFT
jgi:hypothetical protein